MWGSSITATPRSASIPLSQVLPLRDDPRIQHGLASAFAITMPRHSLLCDTANRCGPAGWLAVDSRGMNWRSP